MRNPALSRVETVSSFDDRIAYASKWVERKHFRAVYSGSSRSYFAVRVASCPLTHLAALSASRCLSASLPPPLTCRLSPFRCLPSLLHVAHRRRPLASAFPLRCFAFALLASPLALAVLSDGPIPSTTTITHSYHSHGTRRARPHPRASYSRQCSSGRGNHFVQRHHCDLHYSYCHFQGLGGDRLHRLESIPSSHT